MRARCFRGRDRLGLFAATCVGLATTGFTAAITEYYTWVPFGPVKANANVSQTGHTTNIITSSPVSLQPAAPPVTVISAGMWITYSVGDGIYDVAFKAVTKGYARAPPPSPRWC
jgi:Na+/H+-translocating membrane pyrophosphatase